MVTPIAQSALPRIIRTPWQIRWQPELIGTLVFLIHQGQVLLIEKDNLVTKAHANHLGGRKTVLSASARDIWSTCHQFGIQPIAVHRPGKLNPRAGKLSRWKQDSTDL